MSLSRFTTHLRYSLNQAGPKPFPSPYNVGTDIIKISRIKDIIAATQHDKLAHDLIPLPNCLDIDGNAVNATFRRFIRRVFTHCEWPRLEVLLKLHIKAPNDEEKLATLARWVAGRWAVKEAAIKAHSYRGLHYRDAVVLYHEEIPGIDPGLSPHAPVVLINPSKPEVYMTDTVAYQRGLWRPKGTKESGLSRPFRLAKISMHERQIARASISHDGEYVTAVVYALDEPDAGQTLDPIIDKGYGNPVHEPLLGDTIHDGHPV